MSAFFHSALVSDTHSCPPHPLPPSPRKRHTLRWLIATTEGAKSGRSLALLDFPTSPDPSRIAPNFFASAPVSLQQTSVSEPSPSQSSCGRSQEATGGDGTGSGLVLCPDVGQLVGELDQVDGRYRVLRRRQRVNADGKREVNQGVQAKAVGRVPSTRGPKAPARD